MEKTLRRLDVLRTSKGALMPVIELEDEGHVSPSWTGLNFFTTTDASLLFRLSEPAEGKSEERSWYEISLHLKLILAFVGRGKSGSSSRIFWNHS